MYHFRGETGCHTGVMLHISELFGGLGRPSIGLCLGLWSLSERQAL